MVQIQISYIVVRFIHLISPFGMNPILLWSKSWIFLNIPWRRGYDFSVLDNRIWFGNRLIAFLIHNLRSLLDRIDIDN
jgi:hypothetical protein